jgi:hypothetical protein
LDFFSISLTLLPVIADKEKELLLLAAAALDRVAGLGCAAGRRAPGSPSLSQVSAPSYGLWPWHLGFFRV